MIPEEERAGLYDLRLERASKLQEIRNKENMARMLKSKGEVANTKAPGSHRAF